MTVLSGPPINYWQNKSAPNSPSIIKLNSDIAIAFGLTQDPIFGFANNPNSQQCSSANSNDGNCINPTSTTAPSTAALVQQFAANNSFFLSSFATAFAKMSNVGYRVDSGPAGKLGNLTFYSGI